MFQEPEAEGTKDEVEGAEKEGELVLVMVENSCSIKVHKAIKEATGFYFIFVAFFFFHLDWEHQMSNFFFEIYQISLQWYTLPY